MNISDYKFNVGDEVITVYGEKGKIMDICGCEYCKERGFLEPYWENENGDENYITIGDANRGFQGYYKIGEYKFATLRKDSVKREIEHYEKCLVEAKGRLKAIEEIERIEEVE